MANTINWEDTIEIVKLLEKYHPDKTLENVSLGDIYRWTINLPNFINEPSFVNDEILKEIFQEWFEERNPL